MALILDSEALSALARPRSAPQRHERVRAAMRSAQRRLEPVRLPSAVLVELYRGPGVDEAIDLELARGYAKVITTGIRIARIAGHLLRPSARAASWRSTPWWWPRPSASGAG